jgi:hypothetical protein
MLPHKLFIERCRGRIGGNASLEALVEVLGSKLNNTLYSNRLSNSLTLIRHRMSGGKVIQNEKK